MKVIRIDDAIHAQLKREAKKDGRTLQYIAEVKLSKPFVMFNEYFKDEPTSSYPQDRFGRQGDVGTLQADGSVEPTVIEDTQEWDRLGIRKGV